MNFNPDPTKQAQKNYFKLFFTEKPQNRITLTNFLTEVLL